MNEEIVISWIGNFVIFAVGVCQIIWLFLWKLFALKSSYSKSSSTETCDDCCSICFEQLQDRFNGWTTIICDSLVGHIANSSNNLLYFSTSIQSSGAIHVFHERCMNRYMESVSTGSSPSTKQSICCPLCRVPLVDCRETVHSIHFNYQVDFQICLTINDRQGIFSVGNFVLVEQYLIDLIFSGEERLFLTEIPHLINKFPQITTYIICLLGNEDVADMFNFSSVTRITWREILSDLAIFTNAMKIELFLIGFHSNVFVLSSSIIRFIPRELIEQVLIDNLIKLIRTKASFSACTMKKASFIIDALHSLDSSSDINCTYEDNGLDRQSALSTLSNNQFKEFLFAEALNYSNYDFLLNFISLFTSKDTNLHSSGLVPRLKQRFRQHLFHQSQASNPNLFSKIIVLTNHLFLDQSMPPDLNTFLLIEGIKNPLNYPVILEQIFLIDKYVDADNCNNCNGDANSQIIFEGEKQVVIQFIQTTFTKSPHSSLKSNHSELVEQEKKITKLLSTKQFIPTSPSLPLSIFAINGTKRRKRKSLCNII